MSSPSSLSALFSEPLDDLGTYDPAYTGILAPASARGAAKRGVTAQFLENAAHYHDTYTSHAHFSALIGNALASLDRPVDARVILDVGSGSGNTIFPLLERFPDAFIVASDISAQLLAILRDELERRGDRARVALVCMDATTDPYASSAFDLVVGAAVLHHVIEPDRVIRACEKALRPHGTAIFFEPFEQGQGLLNLAYEEILREAQRRGYTSPAMTMLRQLCEDHAVRMDPGERLETLDDKWMFTRTWFDALVRTGDWVECRIVPIHGDDTPLVEQTRTNLRLVEPRVARELPDWAWSIIEHCDASFTRAAKRDLPLEAAIVLRRGEFAVRSAPLPTRLSGWWWNPAEAGRGFFIDARNDAVRIAACAYDDSGRPVWQATRGERLADRLVLHTDSGSTVRVHFTNDVNATLDWAGAITAIVPQHQDLAAFRGTAWDNLTGWWIDEANPSGCAVLVENLDERVVAALLDGAEWCITVADRVLGRTYAAQWLRFTDGQTMRSAYRAPAAALAIGTSRLSWLDVDTLIVTHPDGRRTLMHRLAASGYQESLPVRTSLDP